MKTLILILGLSLIACSGPDCSNGIMDNNETNIDCGGDCPPCVTAMEQSLEGMWYYHRQVQHIAGTDIVTIQSGTNCKMDLTTTPWQTGHPHYIAYGSVGICNYSGQTGWWINESSGYMNDAYLITVTADSLKLDSADGYNTFYYYK